MAKKASSEYKVVVSGFARGVDKQALDSAMKHKGQSIIVLPQGITTFASGMKKYYKQIIEGNVLVLSTFHPKSPWAVDLAMARNSIIYGLASEIYAAQSDDKGGTWSGVTDGLKKGRTVFVRMPERNEKCANMTLIEMGANAVDMEGNPIHTTTEHVLPELSCQVVAEPTVSYKADSAEKQIVDLLSKGEYSSKQIIEILHLTEYTPQKVSKILAKIDGIQISKTGKTNKYSLKTTQQSEQLTLSF